MIIPKGPEITVTMHPRMWATILTQLKIGNSLTAARIREELRTERLGLSEAVMWSVDIREAVKPIEQATKEAVEKHPTWERWLTNDSS